MPQLNPSNTPIVVEGQDSPLLEILNAVLLELRCIRLALTSMATEGGLAKEMDFDPNFLKTELDVMTQP
jgi:hypothetical protein